MEIRRERCAIACGQKLDNRAAYPLPKPDGFCMLLKGVIFVVVRCVFQVCGSRRRTTLLCAVCPGPGRGGPNFFNQFCSEE